MKNADKKYHYFYKIINLINNKYYYGIHSTNNLNDKYLGSGTYLNRSIIKYGKINFKKEIIKYFNNRQDLVNYEKQFITKEILKDKYCMNCQYGGEYFNTIGMVTVRDINGNTMKVFCDDPKYLSGELIHNTKGMVIVKDINGNIKIVCCDDPKYLSGELISIHKNKIIAKDKNGIFYQISINDPRYISGELVGNTKNKITVKDENDKLFHVDITNPRYISGELMPIWKNKKHSIETKNKMSKSAKNKHNGKLNSQYGTCWIIKDGINKKIKKDKLDYYLNLGWIKGRKIK